MSGFVRTTRPLRPNHPKGSQGSPLVDVSEESDEEEEQEEAEEEEEATLTFPTEKAAVAVAKKDGTLGFRGSYTANSRKVKYFYCSNRDKKVKGQPQTGCPGHTNVIQPDVNVPLWTVEVVHAHDDDCYNLDKRHGIPRAERNRLTDLYDKPSKAQADRSDDFDAELEQLRCVFQYDAKKDSKLFEQSADAIRQTLIAQNRKFFTKEEDRAWLETLVVRVEKWEANGAQERVVMITTAALLRLAEKYNVGGVDATYKVSPRQSCVMVFGVYHERAFLPIALAVSSSRTAGVLPKKGFGSKGETEEHYARFLRMIKELCPAFTPTYFVRDAVSIVGTSGPNP